MRQKHRSVGIERNRKWELGHHFVALEAAQFRHRHKSVALGPQSVDQHGQQLDGAAAVAAGIMHQNAHCRAGRDWDC